MDKNIIETNDKGFKTEEGWTGEMTEEQIKEFEEKNKKEDCDCDDEDCDCKEDKENK